MPCGEVQREPSASNAAARERAPPLQSQATTAFSVFVTTSSFRSQEAAGLITGPDVYKVATTRGSTVPERHPKLHHAVAGPREEQGQAVEGLFLRGSGCVGTWVGTTQPRMGCRVEMPAGEESRGSVTSRTFRNKVGI